MGGIGAKFGVSWEWIYNANRGVIGGNPNIISAGQKLSIPCTNLGTGGQKPVGNPGNRGGDNDKNCNERGDCREGVSSINDRSVQLFLSWVGKVYGAIDTIKNSPKFRQFMGKVIKYEKGVRGARKVWSLTPLGPFDPVALVVSEVELVAKYTVGEKQGSSQKQFFVDAALTGGVTIISSTAADIAGGYAGALGIVCGPSTPVCAAVSYSAVNIGVSYASEELLNRGKEWILNKVFKK